MNCATTGSSPGTGVSSGNRRTDGRMDETDGLADETGYFTFGAREEMVRGPRVFGAGTLSVVTVESMNRLNVPRPVDGITLSASTS